MGRRVINSANNPVQPIKRDINISLMSLIAWETIDLISEDVLESS